MALVVGLELERTHTRTLRRSGQGRGRQEHFYPRLDFATADKDTTGRWIQENRKKKSSEPGRKKAFTLRLRLNLSASLSFSSFAAAAAPSDVAVVLLFPDGVGLAATATEFFTV